MKKIVKILLLILTSAWASSHGITAMALVHIVSAENVYGEVAKELGGPYVDVVNILNNPNQDPHLFSVNPGTAKTAANADILIYNGADYDPWMKSLLAINGPQKRSVIVVAQLMHVKTGSNPHIWYMPETVLFFAQKMTAILGQHDPEHRDYFEQQLKRFNNKYQIIFDMVKNLRKNYQNIPVIATEPLFNYMADSIGLQMHGINFQLSIMNDVPPGISEIKQFETDLSQHHVRVLIYNSQVATPLTKHMVASAQKEKIPVVGVTEMLPPDTTYIMWMTQQLAKLEAALANAHGTQKK